MSDFAAIFDAGLLNSIFRLVTPVLLAALGGMLCDRVGVFNVALEGSMLLGAFAAVVGSYFGKSALAGCLAGIAAGVAISIVFAFFAVTLKGDQMVLGVATNLLISGLTVFLLRMIFGVKGTFQSPDLQGLPEITLPGIDNIPVLGPLFSGHTIVVYLSWLFAFFTYVLLQHHPLGLRFRGIGERPQAAATLGVNVVRLRYLAIALCGALCGLSGAQLSLGNVTMFVENMSAGRGWIAIVAVLLAQGQTLLVVAACLLFGLADAIGFRLQGMNMPSQFTSMLPYVVTLLSLFLMQARRRVRMSLARA